jgi:NAD+ synthase (glutamine-hydrolysing)
VALCQLDTAVGDVDANADKIIESLRYAESSGADVAAFPELAITGYPPEDLLLKPAFIADNLAALERVATSSAGCVALVGFVDVVNGDDLGGAVARAAGAGAVAREAAIRGAPRRLRNAVAVIAGGGVLGIYHKRKLPNYGVFDEERWFAPGTSELELYRIADVPVGVSICEDLWFPGGPIADQAAAGARLILNVNASPFSVGRSADRLAVARTRVGEAGCAIAYVNQVGGQDELVFDGRSFVMDASGTVVAGAPGFEESVLFADVTVPDATAPIEASDEPGRNGSALPVLTVTTEPRDPHARPLPGPPPPLSEEAEVYGRSCSGPGTICGRRASPTPWSVCRGVSTRHWWRRSRSTPSVPSTSMAFPCRRVTRARDRVVTPPPWPSTSESTCPRCESTRCTATPTSFCCPCSVVPRQG